MNIQIRVKRKISGYTFFFFCELEFGFFSTVEGVCLLW